MFTECGGPLKPELVESTEYSSSYPASSVLILGEEDAKLANGNRNYWSAEGEKTAGQGFTLKVDTCARLIAGCQIKNKGKGKNHPWATKAFKVSGAMSANGPWETLIEDELVDTTGGCSTCPGVAASLIYFAFGQPVEIQFIKFDLVSYWGGPPGRGGGLQYFAAIPATSKASINTNINIK